MNGWMNEWMNEIYNKTKEAIKARAYIDHFENHDVGIAQE